MKDQKINLKEIKFFDKIREFFGNKTIQSHLRFTDYWVENMLAAKKSNNRAKPKHFIEFYEKLVEFFQSCNQLLANHQLLEEVKQLAKVKPNCLANEKDLLTYFPYQLKTKELSDPVNVIKQIFKGNKLIKAQQTLNELIRASLNNNYTIEKLSHIITLYSHIKKLMAVCWLIHERVITKNSLSSINYSNSLMGFALTAPSLFIAKEAKDPFLVVEGFFNFTNLSGYRAELQKSYVSAINEEVSHESPSTLLFIHDQYVSLIQAGYLIVSKNLKYIAKTDRNNGITFGKWLLNVRNRQVKEGKIELSDEKVHVLNMQERTNPIAYCKEILTFENVIKLRSTLKAWLYAGLSNQSSTANYEAINSFEFYLILQKLTEAFYLMITANAEDPVYS